jgi:hypothetical protein
MQEAVSLVVEHPIMIGPSYTLAEVEGSMVRPRGKTRI